MEYVRVPTEAILLREAEQRLVPAFRRNSLWLTAVAIDPEVLSAEPHRCCTDNEEVDLRICIARREPGRPGEYRLIDGVHRAIQLYRSGEREIDLCVLGEQSQVAPGECNRPHCFDFAARERLAASLLRASLITRRQSVQWR